MIEIVSLINVFGRHYLISLHVFHCEVKPDSESGIACVRSDKQVILILCDVIHSAQVTCQNSTVIEKKAFQTATGTSFHGLI